MGDDDEGKWARARAIAAEDAAMDKWLQQEYEEHKLACRREARFQSASPTQVLEMYRTQTNEKGQPLTDFEFQALCERWYLVFGEVPPSDDEASVVAEPEPDALPPDDAMLSMRDVVRITGLSKRWVKDPANDFPKPVKLSPRRIGWPADQVKAWRMRRERVGSDRSR